MKLRNLLSIFKRKPKKEFIDFHIQPYNLAAWAKGVKTDLKFSLDNVEKMTALPQSQEYIKAAIDKSKEEDCVICFTCGRK